MLRGFTFGMVIAAISVYVWGGFFWPQLVFVVLCTIAMPVIAAKNDLVAEEEEKNR